MLDFYASDLGTQAIADSKYYWQNEAKNCCIVVPDSIRENKDKPVALYFVQAAPDTQILCTNIGSPDEAEVRAVGNVAIHIKTFDRVLGICQRPANCNKILDAVLDLIDNDSWSFPRAKATEPYISGVAATLLENNFKLMVESPDDGNCLYASIACAGTMLADRMGIKSDIVFDVQHYDTATNTQDDGLIQVTETKCTEVTGRNVIVIDDLISSGRTAQAVIRRLSELGAEKIYYFALYRTISSREIELPKSDNILIQSYIPWSNAYWTYGRGFDLTDEESRALPDIYAATKHWDWETEEDVKDLIHFFTSES